MSDDRDGRNRGEIKNAREKNKERFQKRQEDMRIKALVEAYPWKGRKVSFKIWRKDECFDMHKMIIRGRKI